MSAAIIRKVLHLSDLHIGLNNSTVPADQAEKIIGAILKRYESESPKPIVVITGDIVDYADSGYPQLPQNHLDTALGLLNRLTQAGLAVLVIPGNHDYSASFDTDSFTPVEAIPGIGDAVKIAASSYNDRISNGQASTLVSGMTFDPKAAENFTQKMTPFRYGGPNVSYPENC